MKIEAAEAADGPRVRTWSAYAGIHGSKYLGEVKAETAAGAIEAAYGLDGPSLCHRCASEVEDPEIAHVTVICDDEEATDREEPQAAAGPRLLELVERALEWRGSIGIIAPLGGGYTIELGHALGVEGESLAEAVELALAELARE